MPSADHRQREEEEGGEIGGGGGVHRQARPHGKEAQKWKGEEAQRLGFAEEAADESGGLPKRKKENSGGGENRFKRETSREQNSFRFGLDGQCRGGLGRAAMAEKPCGGGEA